jgi:uncharacterized protein YdaU (DUF1376 family)
MGRPWYSFYPADYGRDTGHLSLIEHGAYRVLMDHYYATEAPLPPDRGRLQRLCRAQEAAEQDAVTYVLAQFFQENADGFRHKRIEAEIEKSAMLSAMGALGGRVRAERRRQKTGDAAGQASAPASGHAASQSLASQSQAHSPSQDSDISPEPGGFEEFWNAYPRREARGLARRAYAKAAGSVSQETLIAAARSYAARREGQDAQFTRLPSTWLSLECWLDDGAHHGAAPPSDADFAGAWNGRAAPLVAEIGAAQFQAYFGEARFTPGPPARVTVNALYLRDLIERKFSGALSRALGQFELEVAA